MDEEQLLLKDCDKHIYTKVEYESEFDRNLRCGYCQMSQINLALAEMGLVEDMLELKAYEVKLGCEEL